MIWAPTTRTTPHGSRLPTFTLKDPTRRLKQYEMPNFRSMEESGKLPEPRRGARSRPGSSRGKLVGRDITPVEVEALAAYITKRISEVEYQRRVRNARRTMSE